MSKGKKKDLVAVLYEIRKDYSNFRDLVPFQAEIRLCVYFENSCTKCLWSIYSNSASIEYGVAPCRIFPILKCRNQRNMRKHLYIGIINIVKDLHLSHIKYKSELFKARMRMLEIIMLKKTL